MSAENRRKLWKFGTLALAAWLIAGCSIVAQEQSSNASGKNLLLPWVVDGEYRFQRIDLNTLLNVSSLQGTSALFLLSPSVSSGKLIGFQPRVRTFVDGEGSHVPTDSNSAQLLGLYAHLEKLEDMDRELGLGQLLPKPRVVGVEVRIPNQQTVRGQVHNNALYSPSLDALLFVPFKGDDLPLAVNAGVIAHEHFHALFNFLVLQSVKERLKSANAAHVHPEDEKQMEKTFTDLGEKISLPESSTPAGEWEAYHENLLRAMNEGLADVWGWIYSGDPVFVRRSLPVLEKARDLNVQGLKVQSMDTFRAYTRSAAMTNNQSQRAYILGTEYARVIKSVFEADMKKREVPRIELAKTILRVLPRLEGRMKVLKDDDWVSPSELLEMFGLEVAQAQPELCAEILTYASDLPPGATSERCGVSVDLKTADDGTDLKGENSAVATSELDLQKDAVER